MATRRATPVRAAPRWRGPGCRRHPLRCAARPVFVDAGDARRREATWKSLIGSSCAWRRRCRPAYRRTTASAVRACRRTARSPSCRLHDCATVPGNLAGCLLGPRGRGEGRVRRHAGPRAIPPAHHDHRGARAPRLVMLCISAPDVLAPERIEVADRIVEQLGGNRAAPARRRGQPFPLRAGRASAALGERRGGPAASARYFGPAWAAPRWSAWRGSPAPPGLKTSRPSAGHRAQVQLGTVQHLLRLLAHGLPVCAARAGPQPERCRSCMATTSFWQYLSEAHGPGKLSLAIAQVAAPSPGPGAAGRRRR